MLMAALFLIQLGTLKSTTAPTMSQQRYSIVVHDKVQKPSLGIGGTTTISLTFLIQEECQAICKNASACQGFTHYNANASPRANFCETFPTIHSSIPCSNCVSGPSSCFCSGEVTFQSITNTVKWSHFRTIHLLLGWSGSPGTWIRSCIRRRLRSTLLGDWGLLVLFLLFSWEFSSSTCLCQAQWV